MIHESIQAAIWQMVPMTKIFDIHVEQAESGLVHLQMPRSDKVLNHLGLFQASTLYALAESATSALYAASFDMSQVELLTLSGAISYKKAANGNVHSLASFDEKTLQDLKNAIDADGKTTSSLVVDVTDDEGTVVCQTQFELLLRQTP